jgi:hypothetical protein
MRRQPQINCLYSIAIGQLSKGAPGNAGRLPVLVGRLLDHFDSPEPVAGLGRNAVIRPGA